MYFIKYYCLKDELLVRLALMFRLIEGKRYLPPDRSLSLAGCSLSRKAVVSCKAMVRRRIFEVVKGCKVVKGCEVEKGKVGGDCCFRWFRG